MSAQTSPRTLAAKVWDQRVVHAGTGDEPDLLYIDLHIVHEVSSAQAFEGLRLSNRRVRRPDLTLATEDHNVPTDTLTITEPMSRQAVTTLRSNCEQFGVPIHRLGEPGQGIVHVIAPEQGLSQPGMTIVCGDSHTCTHGAFGALAFGIGTSEVEHVLATQTLPQCRPRTLAVSIDGALSEGVTAKDLVLALIAQVGPGAGQNHIVEYRGGPVVRAMSMEARMTLCNMSIEFGARAGMVAPDETTFAYLRGRPHAPHGAAWDAALAHWQTLTTDQGATFDTEIHLDASSLSPYVTWGTSPGQAVPLDGAVPDPAQLQPGPERAAAERALEYMALRPGQRMRHVPVDVVFVGSCTNSRVEDLRAAAAVLRGRRIAPEVRMLVVPGSMAVRRTAEAERLDDVFRAAGAEWRNAGCSMCLGMNPDKVRPGQRTASTSNRNFEGRQGRGARTHLVSPAVAAATAISGRLSTPTDIQ